VRAITATLDGTDRNKAARPVSATVASAPEWIAALHEYGPLLLATARSIARDEAEAEDLVQSTFERAIRSAPTIRDPGAIKAWLMTTMTRDALRTVRRLRRTIWFDVNVHEMPITGMETSESMEIDMALRRLSPPIRAAVVLHHMVGYSVRETGEVLGISENTAKARLKTGLARLRELLDA
jgi:RNA polymerase sigma-70 factor, ECF subfamily